MFTRYGNMEGAGNEVLAGSKWQFGLRMIFRALKWYFGLWMTFCRISLLEVELIGLQFSFRASNDISGFEWHFGLRMTFRHWIPGRPRHFGLHLKYQTPALLSTSSSTEPHPDKHPSASHHTHISIISTSCRWHILMTLISSFTRSTRISKFQAQPTTTNICVTILIIYRLCLHRLFCVLF